METNTETRTATTSNKGAFLADAARQQVAYRDNAARDLDVALNCPLSLCNGKTVTMYAGQDGRGQPVYMIEVTRGVRLLVTDIFTSSASALNWWGQYENGNFV